MATITRENIGLLNDKLTVNITKEDYAPSFEQSLKKYAKNANIPGFRKGMVPAGLVKKMYGQSVLTDEILRTVEKELNEYISNEKLDIFAQPLPLKRDSILPDINNLSSYEFSFEIGLKPTVNIDVNNISVIHYKVNITEEMINNEVERLQSRYGNMTEPETITSEDDILNVNFAETDSAGNAIENGINKGNSLLVKYFAPDFQKELLGKQKDTTIPLQLSKAFDEKEREWILEDLGLAKDSKQDAERFFAMTIHKIGFVEKPEMNESFFEKAYPGRGITTEDEFRNAVKVDIENYYELQSRNQMHDQIYHQLLDNSKMEFPEHFLKRWLQNGSEKVKTAEEAEKEYPGFSNQLKWSLISTELIEQNKITVENNELREQARQQILGYMGGAQNIDDAPWLDEYANRMLQDQKFIEQTYLQLQTSKLFNTLENQVKQTEETISAEDFASKLHHHHH